MLKIISVVSLSLVLCLQAQAALPPLKVTKIKVSAFNAAPQKIASLKSVSVKRGGVYDKGNVLISAGLGLGSFSRYGYGNSRSFALPLNLNIAFLVSPIISLGPYVGFMTRSYKYRSGYNDRYTSVTAGGRGNLHGTDLLNELGDLGIDSRLDLYASIFIGLAFDSFSDGNYRGNGYNDGAYLNAGSVIGARYFFAPKLGVYGEVGSGHYAWLTIGGTIKL